jgi:hypothetical protein
MMVPVAGMLWLSALTERPAPFPPVILSIPAAALAFSVFWSKEIRVLPFSREELWRMTWCTAVVLPVVSLFLIRLVVTNPEASLVHAACEFVYLGIAVSGMPLLMVGGASPLTSERVINHGLFVVMLGWIVLPFLVAPLPPDFARLSPWALGALGVGLVASLIPLFRTPESIGRRSPGVANAHTVGIQKPWIFDELSGLTRLMPGHLGAALATCAFVFGIELLPVVFFGSRASGGSSLDATGLLPFAQGQSNADVLQKSGLGMYLAVSMSSGWKDWLRQLKFLPLARWQLVALLSSGPATSAGIFWLILATVHLLTFDEPPMSLRFGLFVFVLGVGTLLGAAWVRGRAFAFLMLAPIVFMTPRISAVVDSTYGLPGVGLVLIVIALVINHRTVTMATSSSRTYQPIRFFGISTPDAPR